MTFSIYNVTGSCHTVQQLPTGSLDAFICTRLFVFIDRCFIIIASRCMQQIWSLPISLEMHACWSNWNQQHLLIKVRQHFDAALSSRKCQRNIFFETGDWYVIEGHWTLQSLLLLPKILFLRLDLTTCLHLSEMWPSSSSLTSCPQTTFISLQLLFLLLCSLYILSIVTTRGGALGGGSFPWISNELGWSWCLNWGLIWQKCAILGGVVCCHPQHHTSTEKTEKS